MAGGENRHILLSIGKAPAYPYLRPGDPLTFERRYGSWRIDCEFGLLADLGGEDLRQLDFRRRVQGEPTGYVMRTEPPLVIYVEFGVTERPPPAPMIGETGPGEPEILPPVASAPARPMWRLGGARPRLPGLQLPRGHSFDSGFGAGFGGCFGVLAAIVVVILFMLSSCQTLFHR